MEIVAKSNNFFSKCLVCAASDKDKPYLKFFRLPLTEPDRSNWLAACGLQEHQLPKHPLICNQHCLSIPLNGQIELPTDDNPKKKLFHVVRNKLGKHFSVDINSALADESTKKAIKIYTFANMTSTEEEKTSKRSSTEEMDMPSMDLDDMMAEIYHHDEGDVSEVEPSKEGNEDFGGKVDEQETEPNAMECVKNIINEILKNVVDSQSKSQPKEDGTEMLEVIEISENEDEHEQESNNNAAEKTNKRRSSSNDDETPTVKKIRGDLEAEEDATIDSVLDEFFNELTSGDEEDLENGEQDDGAGDTSDGDGDLVDMDNENDDDDDDDDEEMQEAYDADDADDDCELLVVPISKIPSEKPIKTENEEVKISDILSENSKIHSRVRKGASKAKVPLDLLKHYKDSFVAMSQSDIEDLILQKVLELNDVQSKCAGQEQLIESYRTTLNKLATHCHELELKFEQVTSEFEAYKMQKPELTTVGTQTDKRATIAVPPLKIPGMSKFAQVPVKLKDIKPLLKQQQPSPVFINNKLTIKKIANLPLKTTVTTIKKQPPATLTISPKHEPTLKPQSSTTPTISNKPQVFVTEDGQTLTAKGVTTTIYNNSIVKNGNSMIYVLPPHQSSAGSNSSQAASVVVGPSASPLMTQQQLQQILQLQHQQQTQPTAKPNDLIYISATSQTQPKQQTAKSLLKPAQQIVKKPPILKHPAPPPAQHYQISDPSWKPVPPQPIVRIKKMTTGIVISWTMPSFLIEYADIACYQLYAYEETNHQPTTDNWRYVGDVKAMLLPIAVTLIQFQEGQRYHFVVRAVDKHNRVGVFSEPQTWKDPA